VAEAAGLLGHQEKVKIPFYFRGSLLETLTLIEALFFLFGFPKFPAPFISYNILKVTHTKRNTGKIYRKSCERWFWVKRTVN
jgi:hypothetical protein